MKSVMFSLLLLLQAQLKAQEHYLLVGTYDSPRSEGIHVYRFNHEGVATEISHTRVPNPSYLTTSADGRFVYAVLENADNGNGGEVASFSFNKTTGELTLLNRQRSGGDHPCYIEIDKTGKWVFVANYSSGTLAVLPVRNDGSLGEAGTIIRHEGSGPDSTRQKSPHVHSTVISADNKWLLVSDLGTDKMMIYGFDAKTGSLSPATKPSVSWLRAGPRHIVFHPTNRYAYMIGELTGVIIAYHYSNGTLDPFQKAVTLENGDQRFPGSADICVSPDGKFLYASNRGEINSIAIFRIGKKGSLTPVAYQSTLGKTPRNFNFDPSGKFLLAANQNSDEIVVFNRNNKSGLLTDTGKRIAIGKPVCIKWISIK